MSEVLPITLATAVPLHIERFRRSATGWPSDDDFREMESFGEVLGEKGDVLLFGGKKGEAADLFNRLARAIAIMSFCPGGVRVFNQHYDATFAFGWPKPRRVRINMDKLKEAFSAPKPERVRLITRAVKLRVRLRVRSRKGGDVK